MRPFIQQCVRALPFRRSAWRENDGQRRGTQSSFWVLFDQAIVSAGNFATNILIARFTDPVTYGRFALCLAGIFFVNSLHTALVIYPLSMSISTGEDRNKPILTISLLLTLLSCLCVALLVAPYLRSIGGVSFVAVAAMVLFAWQAQETCRRAMMAGMHTWQTLLGDFVSYPGQAILIYAVARYQQRFTLPAIFLCMAVTSMSGAVIQFIQISPPIVVRGIWATARKNWTLGRWSTGSALLFMVPNFGVMAVLGVRFGAPAAAALQALLNVARLVNPIVLGTSNAILPRVAAANVRVGVPSAAKLGISLALQGAVLAGPYLLAVMVAPSFMLNLFYGPHSQYLTFSNPLRIVAFTHFFLYVAMVLGSILNALGKPRLSFNGLLAGFTVSAVIGLPLTAIAGVPGAAAAILVDGAARWVPQAFSLRRLMGRRDN